MKKITLGLFVPLLASFMISCSEDEKSNTAVVQTDEPNTTVVDTDEPNTTVVETDEPNTTVVETDEPNTTVVETDEPNTTIKTENLEVPFCGNGVLVLQSGDEVVKISENPEVEIVHNQYDEKTICIISGEVEIIRE
ncbi:hypothetical protein ThvES_00005230 [Thiovulum sp. ES]|nr:hypothetical protein ThvES_00005230 [Thiovulum sp. ES]